ncbi:hypothetical protein [Variovorax paradoxus]|uniref:hypothetical protein n=1 Tax=Variovorax paradoxus TaxID=34073 RepID=UPI003ECCDFE0
MLKAIAPNSACVDSKLNETGSVKAVQPVWTKGTYESPKSALISRSPALIFKEHQCSVEIEEADGFFEYPSVAAARRPPTLTTP